MRRDANYEEVDKARSFLFSEKKSIIYHYTSKESAIEIVKNNTFRLSEYSMVNDRSEYLFSRERYIKLINDKRECFSDEVRICANITMVSMEQNTTLLIGSLTENGDNLSMWDRYADGAKGCAIGFDANWLYQHAGVCVRRVRYGNSQIDNFAFLSLSMLQESFENDPKNLENLKELSRSFILDFFAFKFSSFQSEREIRISRLLVKKEETPHKLEDIGGYDGDIFLPPLPVKKREGQFGSVHYIDIPVSSVKGSAITKISFGPRSDSNGREATTSLLRRLGYQGEFRRSKIPLR